MRPPIAALTLIACVPIEDLVVPAGGRSAIVVSRDEDGITAEAFSVHDIRGSDHRAVLTTLRLPG